MEMKEIGGFRVYFFDELHSTNDEAKRRASSGERNFAVIADRQSGGRGRLGRGFSSEEGGLYMSVALGAGLCAKAASLLTPYAAVCLSRAIEALAPVKAGIKWVNDIFINGKKSAGILSESVVSEEGKLSFAVVGIGVNLKNRLPENLSEIAVTLEEAVGAAPDREALAFEILSRLKNADFALEPADFMQEYRSRSVIIGKSVTVNADGESYEAFVEGIDDSGALAVIADGKRKLLAAGEVNLRIKN